MTDYWLTSAFSFFFFEWQLKETEAPVCKIEDIIYVTILRLVFNYLESETTVYMYSNKFKVELITVSKSIRAPTWLLI